MRFIFLIALLYAFPVMSQPGIYDLSFRTAYDGEISLREYKGRKILIAVVSMDNLNRKGASQFWDSLKTANPKVALILIPAADMDTVSNDSAAMADVRSKTSAKVILADSGMVKKDKREKQHPIVHWLTDVKQNQQFDADVESDQQIYVVSESGVLYAIMEKEVRMSVLDEVLKYDDVNDLHSDN